MSANVLVSAVFVLATVVANLLQKHAVTAIGPVPRFSAAFFHALARSPALWGALAAYALSLAMYLLLLARLPLNVATSIAALNFVAVLLAARLVLGEPIPGLRWLGFGCIALGIYIVSLTQRSPG